MQLIGPLFNGMLLKCVSSGFSQV